MRHSNIHTHTVFSDGRSTPLEMAEKAYELDFVSIGFSDHSEMICPFGESVSAERYRPYAEAVQEVKETMAGKIGVFFGVEKDYFSRIPSDYFEYVIGSVHFLSTPDGYSPIDHTLKQQMEYVDTWAKGDVLEYAKRYFDAVVDHAQKNKFDVQGHFDLVNKFGLFDHSGEAYEKIALEALDAVLEEVPFIEVNTGAIARGYRDEPYPEDYLLKRILEKGGKLILNGDSHRIDHLDCRFNETVEKLKSMGFDRLWQKTANGFESVEL